MEKQCKKCHQVKPLEAFYKKRDSRDGLHSSCKKCHNDKYAETVTFVAGTPQNITHGLNSTDVIVQVRDTSGNVTECEIDITDSSFVTVNSQFISGDLRVVVIG